MAMRIVTAGLDSRKPAQPVIVLETGAGGTSDHWKPIFSQIATLGPVLAYDRRGLGESDVDSVPQTLERVAMSLHNLLEEARIPPPYILVGASWGGAFTRKFGTLFPGDVAAFVHLDVTDIDATGAELKQLPKGAEEAIFNTPPLPNDAPAGLLAEFRSVAANVNDEFKELRTLRPPTEVPVVVVIAGGKSWPGLSEEARVALVQLQIRHQSAWVLPSPKGMVLVASKARHFLFNDEPALVLQAISYAVNTARPR
jgi:pimeloyl-ACP methyl ester carboxylesterase